MSTRSKDFRQIVRDNNLYKPAPDSYNSKGSFNNPKGVYTMLLTVGLELRDAGT